MSTTTQGSALEPDALEIEASRERGGPSKRRLVQPVAVFLMVAGCILYVAFGDINVTAQATLNFNVLWSTTLEHIQLSAVTTVIVVGIAVPTGILLTRQKARPGRPGVVAVANLGQAAPSVGLLVLFAALLGVGFWTAVIGLSVYGILPTLRNTMTGLEQVDRRLVEAARGMGMSAWATLLRVELPLAVPVILTGIRLSLVLIVGTAALATFIGAGGLGQLVTTGVTLQLNNVLIVGAVLIAALALLVDWLGRIVEDIARPKGLS